ncbi:hypothetical protein [Methylocystis sp. B8]|uniref:hypothetical protein n=1 Tax=Methylocystis sp. B8 TaxID=544938 RepID=UPI0010FEAF72|nr:hypothetical protein [Methylocystis sp. B8]TLG77815.1 hypothetical protein FEV16_08325 [Methylocystis sp. B8]
MLNWLRRRSISRALVESDAHALIERFGEDAYLEARLRQHNDERVIDGNRPLGHWERVKEAIRKRRERR